MTGKRANENNESVDKVLADASKIVDGGMVYLLAEKKNQELKQMIEDKRKFKQH